MLIIYVYLTLLWLYFTQRKRSKEEDCEDLPVTPVKWDPDIVIEEWSSGSSDSDIVIEEVQDADNKENSIPYDV